MSRPRVVCVALAPLAVCALAVALRALDKPLTAEAQGPPGIKPIPIKTPVGQRLSIDEHKYIVSLIHSHFRVDPKKTALRVLHARPAEDEDKDSDAPGKPVVKAITVDYATGQAKQVVLDPKSGKVLREEVFSGRPQSSSEERAEAARIIRADKTHAKLLGQGVLEGGFIVDPPKEVPEANRKHRFVKMDLLTKDRERFLRTFYVDLTTGAVAAATQPK